MVMQSARIETPIGAVRVFVAEGGLVGLGFEDGLGGLKTFLNRRFGGEVVEEANDPAGVATRLGAYFAGDLAALDAIRVDPGGTPFQRDIWSALRKVPAGSTISYSGLAAAAGHAEAVRATGLANARNPIAIVIPCHRVIGADGSLTGYGGGIERKRWLLRHEAKLRQLPWEGSASTR